MKSWQRPELLDGAAIRQFVRQRADNYCEYGRLAQEKEPLTFHVEHIIPRQHGGSESAENLALACHHCNLHKGTNLTGVDTPSSELTRLFHPRSDKWNEHFRDQAGEIMGLTAIGRVTVQVLKMNDQARVKLRSGK